MNHSQSVTEDLESRIELNTRIHTLRAYAKGAVRSAARYFDRRALNAWVHAYAIMTDQSEEAALAELSAEIAAEVRPGIPSTHSGDEIPA